MLPAMSPCCAQRLNMANKGTTRGSFIWRPSAVPALTIIFPGSSCKQDKLSLNYFSKHTKTPFAYDWASLRVQAELKLLSSLPVKTTNASIQIKNKRLNIFYGSTVYCKVMQTSMLQLLKGRFAAHMQLVCIHGSVQEGKNTVLFLWTTGSVSSHKSCNLKYGQNETSFTPIHRLNLHWATRFTGIHSCKWQNMLCLDKTSTNTFCQTIFGVNLSERT